MSTIEAPRPTTEPPETPSHGRGQPARSRFVRAWPIASRLARREVQRRPGRTILVMLLVLLPVFAMTAGSVLVRSDTSSSFFGGLFELPNSITARPDLSPTARFEQETGLISEGTRITTAAADPIDPVAEVPFTNAQVADLEAAVGDRAEVIWTTAVFSDVATASAVDFLELVEWPDGISDNTTERVFEFDSGRAPATANEVFLSRNIADSFGVTTGDELVLTSPARRWDVVGVGRNRASFSDSFAMVGALDRSDVVPEALMDSVSVIPFDEVSESELSALSAEVGEALGTTRILVLSESFMYEFGDSTAQALAWGWVGGVVSLFAVGVVISAAFATSARRQLATVGQLSANGAPAKVIERSLALQGSWTGLLGSLLGIGIGLAAVFSAWGLFEELLGYELADRQVAAFDLVVIAVTATVAATIAALLPAKSAARVPVLTALAGRRPVGKIPRWMIPLGVATMLAGLGLLAVVAFDSRYGVAGNLEAILAVVGSVSIMVGLINISPVLVEMAGRIGQRWPGSALIAVRSLVRQRTRSAAVISAIAAVVALTMVGLTALGIAQSADESNTIQHRTVGAYNPARFDSADLATTSPLPQWIADEVESVVPNARRIDVEAVPIGSYGTDQQAPQLFATVATDEMLPLLGLSDNDLEQLQATGVLVPTWVDAFGVVVLDQVLTEAAFSETEFDNSVVFFEALATPEWVAESGLESSSTEVLWINDVALSTEQRRSIREIETDGFVGSAFISVLEERVAEEGLATDDAPPWEVSTSPPRDLGVPWQIIQAVALGAALLLVLGVVSIGLGLAAVESRDERSVLHVVGAPPSLLRKVAAAKTWVLTTSAAIVAVPLGFIVVWVVRAASKSELEAHAGVPWLAMISLLLLVPALAAAATWIGSSVTSRFRPVTASRMRLD